MYGFELCGSIYTWIPPPPINAYTVLNPCLEACGYGRLTIYLSTPFYIGDLSICRFRHAQSSGTNSPWIQRVVKVLEEPKIYVDFQLHRSQPTVGWDGIRKYGVCVCVLYG